MSSWSHALGGPVLPQAGDPVAVEFEDGDFAHPFAVALDDVVESGFPLRDGGRAVEVKIEQLGLNVGLRFDDFALPILADPGMVTDWFPNTRSWYVAVGVKTVRIRSGSRVVQARR